MAQVAAPAGQLLGPCHIGLQRLAATFLRAFRGASAAAAAATSDSAEDGVFADFAYASEDGQTPDACVRRCFVANGRQRGHTLERDGFALSSLPLHEAQGCDLYDPLAASGALYPLAEGVLRRAFPGSSKVVVFDHIARNAARYAEETREGQAAATPMLSSGPAFSVHGDYTVRSGYSRARSLLEPHETEERIGDALKQRFAFVNVWVPLKPVERDPLAMIEWESQRPRDVVNLQFIYTHRVGEIYRVLPSDQHRWAYFPGMAPGECLVFKVFDSAEDGRARFSLHAAFRDPTSRPDAPARESIELRCIVFFGDLPPDFAASFVAPHLLPGSPDQDLNPERVASSLPNDEW